MYVLMEKLKEIQLKIRNVGVKKLFLEAKRRKVPGITLDAVKLYLATDESKQLFRPLPESKGKTTAEAQQFRVQMDLIDMKYSPSRIKGKGPQYKYALVLIDVMSRFIWTAPLINKEPATVEPVLRQIINSMESQSLSVLTRAQSLQVLSTRCYKKRESYIEPRKIRMI